MPDAWPGRRWWGVPFAATRFWWCTVGWWQRCAIGAVVSLWLLPSLVHIGVGDYWRAFQDIVVCLIFTALFMTADLDRRMARRLAGDLYSMSQILQQVIQLAPDLCYDGTCASCSQELLGPAALGVMCRPRGHVVHITCLTLDEGRHRCPLCLAMKEKTDA